MARMSRKYHAAINIQMLWRHLCRNLLEWRAIQMQDFLVELDTISVGSSEASKATAVADHSVAAGPCAPVQDVMSCGQMPNNCAAVQPTATTVSETFYDAQQDGSTCSSEAPSCPMSPGEAAQSPDAGSPAPLEAVGPCHLPPARVATALEESVAKRPRTAREEREMIGEGSGEMMGEGDAIAELKRQRESRMLKVIHISTQYTTVAYYSISVSHTYIA